MKNIYTFFIYIIIRINSFCQSPILQLNEVANGLYRPTDVESASDNRLFISQMNGKIVIFENGLINPIPFLDISAKIRGSEYSGIFGFCFHPNYVQNGYLYVHYLIPGKEYSRYSRFTRNANNSNIADSNSELIIYEIPYLNNGHRSGDFNFGPDGFLYISTGDGAAGARSSIGDINNNAQNLQSVFGKILRIDVNGALPYSIPATNPYLLPNDNIPDETWAIGLRNPWRWSFDKQNGDIWLGDNGQDGWEEVNYLPNNFAGNRNFGWRCYEGSHIYLAANCNPLTSHILPIIDYAGYDNNSQMGASVVGGFVYRGAKHPNLRGWYIYADYAQGKFWTLKPSNAAAKLNTTNNILQNISLNNPVSFGQDASGEIYVVNFFEGKLFEVKDTSTPLPLTLIDFFVKNEEENNIILHWKTANEVDFSHFEIQKSIAAKKFETLGIVQSKGVLDNGNATYSFVDKILNINELNEFLYFRLKMVEANGQAQFSRIIGLNLDDDKDQKIKIIANPVENGHFKLEINNKKSTKFNAFVMSTSGQLLIQKSGILNNGLNIIDFNLENHQNEMVILRIEVGDKFFLKKIIL